MIKIDSVLRAMLVLALICGHSAIAVSQEDAADDDAAVVADEEAADEGDDPFGDVGDVGDESDAAPADEESLDASDDEAAASGDAATPTRPRAERAIAEPTPPAPVSTENQAAVDVIRQSEPKTAEQLFTAVDQLLRLNRPDVAQEYWQQLLALPFDDTQRAQLHQRFGTARLIRLSRSTELTPAPSEFVKQVFAAARSVADDPGRLQRLVAQLESTDRDTQYQAAVQLLRAGSRAVPPIVQHLAKSSADAPSHATPVAMEIMQRLGADAVDPLIAFQSSNDEPLRLWAIRGLAVANQPASLPYLVQPLFGSTSANEQRVATAAWQRMTSRVPDRSEALQLVRRAAERAYAGEEGSAIADSSEKQRWIWSESQRQPVLTTVTATDAAALNAARLYRDLWQMDGRADDQLHYLTSRFAVEQALVGLDQPLPRGEGTFFAEAAKASSWVLSQALAQAITDGQDVAAMAACELLGASQDFSVLQADGDELSPLALALTHPNARVRFAAAQAIGQLKPIMSFAGQGHWEDALRYFSASDGRRTVIVAHPQPLYGQKFAGLLSEFGYQAKTVTTSQQLIKAATESPDVELILVSDAMNEETIWANLESLRSGPKTARIPVAILSRLSRLDEMQLIAEDQPRVLVLAETIDGSQLATYIPRLHELAGRDSIPAERRLEQATAARGWIQTRQIKFDGDRTSPLKN